MKQPKGFKPSAPPMSAVDIDPFIMDLVNLKDRAGRLGLYATMQELDKAAKRVGYEVADKRARQTRDEHAG